MRKVDQLGLGQLSEADLVYAQLAVAFLLARQD